MALINIRFFSNVLGRQSSVDVVMPQTGSQGEIGVSQAASEKGAVRSLMLLHGLSDDGSIWLRRTCIERYASDYGIAVICPSADRSFYTNMIHGDRYFDYIAKEVPAIVSQFLNISTKREDRFIAGNSMGGYGAIKIALKENKSFSKAAGLSSVADISNFKDRIPDLWNNIFGDSDDFVKSEDLLYLSEKINCETEKPDIFLCTGTSDFLYKDNVKLKEHFETLDYNFTYREWEGRHTWDFWEEHIKDVLKWMLEE